MKKILLLMIANTLATTALAATPAMTNGFYAGAGGSFNTVDESVDATFFINSSTRSRDNYSASSNRMAPMLQLGYWKPVNDSWLWGLVAQWKYLNYQTANVNGNQGQYLPSASFSSINFFGAGVERNFTSQTQIKNELLLLVYFGMQLQNSYLYLGLGPAWTSVYNNIYVYTVHTPGGTGSNLISTSANSNNNVWGGAAQAGYNYFLSPTWFLSLNYTYLQTQRYNFNNTANAAILNGSSVPGPTTLTLKRAISFSTQEVMFSINKSL